MIKEASSAWQCWPVLAKKKNDGVEWEDAKRFCLDVRKLNGATMKHARLLPKIMELVDAMSGAVYFSKVDLKGAYNQIKLTEKAAQMSNFAFWVGECINRGCSSGCAMPEIHFSSSWILSYKVSCIG